MTEEELLQIIEQAAQNKETFLNLSRRRLTELPPEIGQLTNLTGLYLGGNQLTTVPTEIGQLTNLTVLNLGRNQLTTLPSEIWQLTNLKKLYLGGNQLTTVPAEIGQLTNLIVLNLRWNQLTTVSAEIGQLTNLTSLDLSGNQLTTLPSEIGQLRNLTRLDLWRNQMTTLPSEIGQLRNLIKLNLNENQLTTVPAEIGNLTNLTVLNLWENQMTTLPSEIGQLTNLIKLSLWRNQLTTVPAEIGQLTNLTELDLWRNQLTTLPAEIGNLTNLTELSLSWNQLTTLPAEIGNLTQLKALNLEEESTRWSRNYTIYLGGNPLVYPAPEILNQGIEATFAYLRAALPAQQPQWVSKLIIVGERGVGKTSLIKALLGILFDSQESTTHGIDIRHLELPHPSQPDVLMQLNAWDFGGQQIYHATYQFFLTNRSLFLLAWNACYGYEQGKLHDWLDTLASLAPDSKILLVATHLDERTPSIPFSKLQRQYPQIIGQCEVSSKTGTGIDTLRHSIAKAAAQLPLMGKMWPKTWLDAANEIRSLPEKYITPQQLATRMTANGVAAESVPILTKWLHELGDILYFQNKPELNEIVILKPTWVTENISRVLESQTVKQHRGILTRAEMNHLWQDIDPFMREHFLHLMECFDLSYQIHNEAENRPQDASLIVECLPLDTPDYQSQWDAILTTDHCQEMSMKWQFNILPVGIPTWFIARSHRFSTGIHWRNGVLLADNQPPKHLALLQAFPQQKSLQLTVRGTTPIHFFSLLRDRLEIRFSDLEVQCTIPCPNHDQCCSYEFEERDLQECYQTNKHSLECPECKKNLSVIQLLFGLNITPTSSKPETLSLPTFSVLPRFEELEEQINAGKRSMQSALRELAKVHQDQFIKIVRLQQQSINADSPCVFVLKSSHQLCKTKFELQLCCEAPGEWHPVNSGLYEIDNSDQLLKVISPYTHQLIASLKYSTSEFQADFNDSEQFEVLHQKHLESMKTLVEGFISPEASEGEELLKLDVELEQLQQLTTLKTLQQFLNKKGSHQHWGGLTKILIPEGHYLWLCDHHRQQYKK